MSESEPKSVTRNIQKIRSEDDWTFQKAAADVYARYAAQLMPVVRREMAKRLSARIDPEDVVNAAMNTFYRRHRSGEYNVPNRESLWNLLVTIARNKTSNERKFHRRQKRDYQKEHSIDGDSEDQPRPQLAAKDADGESPVNGIAAKEATDELLAKLPEQLRPVALLLLSGHSTSDIAEKFGCSTRTIERRIRKIGELLCEETGK